MELTDMIYNDRNRKKAETVFGKGGSEGFLKFAIGFGIFCLVAIPVAIISGWYFLSGRISELFVVFLVLLFMLMLFPMLFYIVYRQYHYDLKKRDFIVFEDRIQLSHPRMTLTRDDIEEIIIDTDGFKKNRKAIRERAKKKFFKIANRLMTTGMKDLKKHFIDHNAVIILHKRKEDRLGIQLLDRRAHNDMDDIKAALIEFMGPGREKPRKIGKIGAPRKIPDIVTVRARFDSRNHNKVLLKVTGTFLLVLVLTILAFKLESVIGIFSITMFITIFSGVIGIFCFAFILGGITMKLNGAGSGYYTIDGTYVNAQVASTLGYKIPLKAVESVEKWPDENNGHFFKMLKYDRSAAHLPAHCLKYTFLMTTSKAIWPITKLGGARPHTMFFMGDDEESTGYNYIKNHIENRSGDRSMEPGRKLEKKKRKREKMDDIIRIRFFDKRSVSRNFGVMYILAAAYLIMAGFYLFFLGISIHALLKGNLKALIVIPLLIFYHLFMMMVRTILVSSFSIHIPYRKFRKEKLVIGKRIITIPWYDGLFGVKKIKLERSKTEIIDFEYRKIGDEDLDRFKKLKGTRWILLFWPFNRRILGRVQHPFDRDLLFINDNRAYFFPTDMLEEDYQRKLDGIIEYGDDIYDE